MDEKEFLQQIEELRANEEFVAKIKEAQTVEDFVQAHRDAGFDIDASDIEAIKMPEETGDLSEEDLENVAGGGAGLALLGYGIKYFWDTFFLNGGTSLETHVIQRIKKTIWPDLLRPYRDMICACL